MNEPTPSIMSARADEPLRGGRGDSDAAWQRNLIEELARDALVERRRARRWRIFFRLAGFGVVVLALLIGFGLMQPAVDDTPSGDRHTALIEIEGVLAAGGEVEADRVN